MKYLGVLFVFLFIFSVAVLYIVIGEGDLVNIIDVTEHEESLYDDTKNNGTADNFLNLSVLQPLPPVSVSEVVISENWHEFTVYVYDFESNDIFHGKLDDYLCGVVFAEMPSTFEVEALKAQAVAARSYYVYKTLNSSENERELHRGADICTDPTHCKAYISYEKARNKWGEEYISPLWGKVEKAVTDTSGQIIVYESEPAIAVFHAISNKNTESAENIWGGNVPYLVSVPTSESENADIITNFSTIIEYNSEELKSKLISNGFRGDFDKNPEKWIGSIVLNSSGRVDNIEINSKLISGNRMREIFSLRSADFTLEYKKTDDKFIFSVKGYGHGVGMSQYGANLMAREGKSYKDILLWYYAGVDIINIYEKPFP